MSCTVSAVNGYVTIARRYVIIYVLAVVVNLSARLGHPGPRVVQDAVN